MRKSFKYRLYPKKSQRTQLERWLGLQSLAKAEKPDGGSSHP